MAPGCACTMAWTMGPAVPMPAGAVVSRAPKTWRGEQDWRGTLTAAAPVARRREAVRACIAAVWALMRLLDTERLEGLWLVGLRGVERVGELETRSERKGGPLSTPGCV